MSRIYLDANALIDAVERQDSRLAETLANLDARGWVLLTSQMSLAEILVVPIKEERTELIAIYDDLLGPDRLVRTVPVDEAVLRESAALRARSNQKLPDAIHVATARLSRCSILLSSDKGLKLPEEIRQVSIDGADAIGGPQ